MNTLYEALQSLFVLKESIGLSFCVSLTDDFSFFYLKTSFLKRDPSK